MSLFSCKKHVKVKPSWGVNVTITPEPITGKLSQPDVEITATEPSGLPDIGAYEYQGT